MTSSDYWDAETAARYDESSAAMFAPGVLEPTVGMLARLAGSGRALEFAVGTGRVAIPLLERGIDAQGIELSEPMIDELRKKVSRDSPPVTVGDMAPRPCPERSRSSTSSGTLWAT